MNGNRENCENDIFINDKKKRVENLTFGSLKEWTKNDLKQCNACVKALSHNNELSQNLSFSHYARNRKRFKNHK